MRSCLATYSADTGQTVSSQTLQYILTKLSLTLSVVVYRALTGKSWNDPDESEETESKQ